MSKEIADLIERAPLPESLKGTSMYAIADNVGLVLQRLELVPDILSGRMRARRFGAWIGMHIVPDLDKATEMNGPVILPSPPAVFLDADSLDTLRERIIYEIDTMINSAKKMGEKNESGGLTTES